MIIHFITFIFHNENKYLCGIFTKDGVGDKKISFIVTIFLLA